VQEKKPKKSAKEPKKKKKTSAAPAVDEYVDNTLPAFYSVKRALQPHRAHHAWS
jgi:hypothetical protein